MLVLGIETSCDETALALVDSQRQIRANLVRAQLVQHAPYGGVVPEVAARAHLELLPPLLQQAFAEAGCDWPDISAIAATAGPGLIGGVMVGLVFGKALAAARHLPFIGVNHLEGHALTPRLSHNVAFPYLLLLVSGGHCQLLWVRGVGDYQRLGATIDDAAGEAFDKSAKLLGLGYPGGPALEQAAKQGDANAVPLPRPFLRKPHANFSFSGLKTAVRLAVAQAPLTPQCIADIAAATQAAIADCLADRTLSALTQLQAEGQTVPTLVVAGGVAANMAVRASLQNVAAAQGCAFVAPPLALCTDNAAMIAWAGLERLQLGAPDDLSVGARPRWPLDETAPPLRGAGVKA